MQDRSYIRFILLFIVYALFSYSVLKSQTMTGRNLSDTLPSNSKIEIRSEKIANTFTFNGSAFIDLDLDFGNIRVLQNYRGTSIKSSSAAFRDDEMFLLDYEYSFLDNFFLVAKQNWLFSSDSRSLEINRLERLNGRVGLKYLLNNKFFVEAVGGIEKNQLIGHSSTGPIINLSAGIDNYDLYDYKINTRVKSEYLSLDFNRVNAEINWLADIDRIYDDNNMLGASLKYKLMNRDFLKKNSNNEYSDFSVESRLEKKINSVIDVDFLIGRSLLADVTINFSKLDVQKQFSQEIPDLPISKVHRSMSELQLGFASEITYLTDDFEHSTGISFDIRDEDNAISNKFDINEQDESRLRSIENQRDNSSSRTKFFFNGEWKFTRYDSIAYSYSASLFEYDTPSDDNNDDRDEFSSIFSLTYFHRFSSFLRMGITGEIQQRHLVFIKAERSAMNNWNRIYRINTQFEYMNKYLKYNPYFEILANYTIYDFESVSPSVQSFSYRQISYRDSLFIYLSENLILRSRLIFRYYERGVLYWESFSESPQSSGLEEFLKFLLIIKNKQNYKIGCGLRFYNFYQSNLKSGVNTHGMGEFSQRSWGPEVLIEFRFDSGISINMEGWYEFQYLNNGSKRIIPNFFLKSTYNL